MDTPPTNVLLMKSQLRGKFNDLRLHPQCMTEFLILSLTNHLSVESEPQTAKNFSTLGVDRYDK